MKIYNEDYTIEYNEEELNLELGYLTGGERLVDIEAQEGVEEEGHYETIAEYPNGGKDVKWVVDKEGRDPIPFHQEIESVLIYIPYTKDEIIEKRINKYKANLSETDYRAIKYIEGWYTEEEYAPYKEEREHYRQLIRKYEGYKENPNISIDDIIGE